MYIANLAALSGILCLPIREVLAPPLTIGTTVLTQTVQSWLYAVRLYDCRPRVCLTPINSKASWQLQRVGNRAYELKEKWMVQYCFIWYTVFLCIWIIDIFSSGGNVALETIQWSWNEVLDLKVGKWWSILASPLMSAQTLTSGMQKTRHMRQPLTTKFFFFHLIFCAKFLLEFC